MRFFFSFHIVLVLFFEVVGVGVPWTYLNFSQVYTKGEMAVTEERLADVIAVFNEFRDDSEQAVTLQKRYMTQAIS